MFFVRIPFALLFLLVLIGLAIFVWYLALVAAVAITIGIVAGVRKQRAKNLTAARRERPRPTVTPELTSATKAQQERAREIAAGVSPPAEDPEEWLARRRASLRAWARATIDASD